MRFNNKPKSGWFTASKNQVAVTPPTPILDRLTPSDCIQYPLCGIQICPFDSEWKKAKNYSSEAVCPYLKEAMKEKPNPFFATFYGEGLLEELKAVIPVMMKQLPIIRKGLKG